MSYCLKLLAGSGILDFFQYMIVRIDQEKLQPPAGQMLSIRTHIRTAAQCVC
jgi:hypothetical protein